MEMYIASYQQEEEEKARLRQRLSKEAIDLALQGRWEEAEAVNRDIIEKFPTDVEAYNRLGRALTESGDFDGAKGAYFKTLELAPDNAIAKKNLARLTSLSESMATLSSDPQKASTRRTQARRVALDLFITEMGKAGVVNLHNVASGEVLAKMGFGDQVYLEARGQHLIVASQSGEYLGEVEPRQGLRLIKLMQGGNRYDVAILNVEEDKVQVIIKEVYQHPSQVGRPSFLVKATEHLRTRIKESLLRRGIITDENEASPELGYLEEEEELGPEEESLPEGFTVVGEDGERGIEI
ncbi:MAG TPA: tetratricopeptide repeat protein [Dehalococcoidia bacterium]|nr:tetratricopeptide repeat protein [Dehalococcoidia bacterium]